MKEIIIIDYGLGNVFNVSRAFEAIDAKVIISSERQKINNASHIVLPGVGAFSEGICQLEKRNLPEILINQINKGKPILGICLGMQLFMTKSEEFGKHSGLNFIPGNVIYLHKPINKEFKIPHMGWNKICAPNNARSKWQNTILKGIPQNAYMYFVHSLHVQPENKFNVLSETAYGHNNFCSSIIKDNIYGCQFHPERSGKTGLRILKNFIEL